jgi:hypothetical protein
MAKKQQGIQGLPAFILNSQQIFIMWDSMYFTRGWCCFELAVFKALRPDDPIRIFPVELQMVMIFQGLLITLMAYVQLWLSPVFPGVWGWDVTTSTCVFILSVTQASSASKCTADRKELIEQLETFDIEQAKMTVESDRTVILRKSRSSLTTASNNSTR